MAHIQKVHCCAKKHYVTLNIACSENDCLHQSLSYYHQLQYACELSRGETRPKGDKDDQYKEKTEKELWSRKVEKAELHNGKTTRMMNTEVDIDEVTEVTTK